MKKRYFTAILIALLVLTLFAAPTQAAGDGTTFNNAIDIVFGETYYKSWTSSTDHLNHYNKITLPQRGIIQINATKPFDSKGEYGRIKFYLYDSNDNTVWGSECYYTKDSASDSYKFNVGLDAGTYYLTMKPAFTVTSGRIETQYSIKFTANPYCEVEPNESGATATQIKIGKTYSGFFGTDGADSCEENDFWKVQFIQGHQYAIAVGNFGAIDATTILIHLHNNQTGEQISLNWKLTSISSDGMNYYLYTAPNDGIYFIQIYNYGRKQVSYTLRVSEDFAITEQPKNVTVNKGQQATFRVIATGADLDYQWFSRPNANAQWTVVEGATSNIYTVVGTKDNNGWQYRCRLQDESKTLYSNEATLTVTIHPPVITSQPQSVTVRRGANATFTVTANGAGSYQWFEKAPGAASWTQIDGATSNTLTVVASQANNGWQYRCLVKNADGEVYSNAATLTVTVPAPPTIKTQPKNANVKSGSKAKFTVKVKEKNVTYQWSSKAPGAADWTAMAGENKATLNVVGTKANSGTQYRCRVRTAEGGEIYTIAVTLTVKTQAPVIKTQPKSLTAKSGKKVKFSVKASGKNITHQWFTRADAKSEWQPVAGGNKKDLNVVASKANNGSQYYCYLKNADGDATSAIVTLTVTPEAPTIKTQPKDAKVKIGAKAKFKVKASGKNVTYQWYYRTSETSEWVLMEGETSANLTVTATADKIGWQFRCLAKNADGQAYSNPATLRQK